MLQHIVKLTPEMSKVVETIRNNTTQTEFQQLPVNEQTNYIVDMILRNTFEQLENVDDIMLSLGLV